MILPQISAFASLGAKRRKRCTVHASPTAYELYLKVKSSGRSVPSKVSSKALITFSKRLVWIPTTLLRMPGWRTVTTFYTTGRESAARVFP